jgi:hypothetical protein
MSTRRKERSASDAIGGQAAPRRAHLQRVLVILDWDPTYPLCTPGMKEEVAQADLILGVQDSWSPVATIKNLVNANVTTIGCASRWPSSLPGQRVLVIVDWHKRSERERARLGQDITAADLVLGVREPWQAVDEIRNELGAFVMNAVA